MSFGKGTQEVVCIGQLIRSAYLACIPLALSCVEIGYFVFLDTSHNNQMSKLVKSRFMQMVHA